MSVNSPILSTTKQTIWNHSDMAKVAIKSENITSFGGIFYVMDMFSRLGLEKLIDSSLGTSVYNNLKMDPKLSHTVEK